MLGEADGVDDELDILVAADGLAEPARLRIRAVLAVEKDPAHEMVPLPQYPHLLRQLNEIERLGVEQQLGRPAWPAARHRAERAAALAHQFIMHPHLRGGPGRQIGVLGIGEALDVPWTYAAWPLPAWIGCRFGRLIVEIGRREPNTATPVPIGSDGRHRSLDGPVVEARVHQPAEIGRREIGNGAVLRLDRRDGYYRTDQRHSAE